MSDGFKVDISEVQKLLKEEEIPDLGPSQLGRIRLMRALERRFGKGFKAIPGPRKALKDFDDQVKDIRTASQERRKFNGI